MIDRSTVIWIAGALLLTGCQSQWYEQHYVHNLITTDVVIRSEPAGARIQWETASIGKAPVRLPVEYDHTEQLWTRQNNQGARMREDMGTVMTILTFPVWAIASLFHTTEDRRRHVYGHNTFAIMLTKPGYNDAHRVIELEGEDEVDVMVRMKKR